MVLCIIPPNFRPIVEIFKAWPLLPTSNRRDSNAKCGNSLWILHLRALLKAKKIRQLRNCNLRDNGEDEPEQLAEYGLIVIQLNTDVERFHPSQILKTKQFNTIKLLWPGFTASVCPTLIGWTKWRHVSCTIFGHDVQDIPDQLMHRDGIPPVNIAQWRCKLGSKWLVFITCHFYPNIVI